APLRPHPHNADTTGETFARSRLKVPPPPTCSTRCPRTDQKRPGTSASAHPAKPPSVSSQQPSLRKAIMNRTDRVLPIPDRSCATYRPGLNAGKVATKLLYCDLRS